MACEVATMTTSNAIAPAIVCHNCVLHWTVTQKQINTNHNAAF